MCSNYYQMSYQNTGSRSKFAMYENIPPFDPTAHPQLPGTPLVPGTGTGTGIW